MFILEERMSGNWDFRWWGEFMVWFWFVVDKVNKEKMISWVLNKSLLRIDL